MEQDEYGKHTISNIYFDTDEYDLIRKSLEKPIYKEKLRLRAYGIPSENSDTFIEIKKKFMLSRMLWSYYMWQHYSMTM